MLFNCYCRLRVCEACRVKDHLGCGRSQAPEFSAEIVREERRRYA